MTWLALVIDEGFVATAISVAASAGACEVVEVGAAAETVGVLACGGRLVSIVAGGAAGFGASAGLGSARE